ncbi:MAG TPA: hypothetical protein VHH34_23750 [Pseudonocardiaceae bacterium]|nr:hypothetical protein [Pseudonocardiaceae bacterium]
MPRRNDPRRAGAPRALDGLGWATSEHGPDGEWLVRTVPGARTLKSYRCPGCDHEIRPGTAHVVSWPAGESSAERRHWHAGCWSARDRCFPARRRR